MKKLLFLVHRLPYPPNKGDKISSYNMLKYFARGWRVHLGTFIDDPEDWVYTKKVTAMCEDSHFVGLPKSKRLTASVRGMVLGESLSATYYRSRELFRWVEDSVESEAPDAVLIYSGAMGQYIPDGLPSKTRVVFNCEDVDSEKWRSYAGTKQWPLSMLYAREAKKLLAFERSMALKADITTFISEDEANLFKRRAPESAAKIAHRVQGVDANYFDPDVGYENPYKPGERPFVFTGAMDYWPNVEAVQWYCDEVLPGVLKKFPKFVFYIVGMKPSDEVRRLGQRPGVTVTGTVDDVRPYLAHAIAGCLPLRIARGIQNKALEAMSMSLPLLATSFAVTGIAVTDLDFVWIADDKESMLQKSLDFLESDRKVNTPAREFVLSGYDWTANLAKLEKILVSGTI